MLRRVLEVRFVNPVFFILVKKGAKHALQFEMVALNLDKFGLVERLKLEIYLES